MWTFFPDTRGLALEEISALFGDDDEMVSHALQSGVMQEMQLDLEEVNVSQKRE